MEKKNKKQKQMVKIHNNQQKYTNLSFFELIIDLEMAGKSLSWLTPNTSVENTPKK